MTLGEKDHPSSGLAAGGALSAWASSVGPVEAPCGAVFAATAPTCTGAAPSSAPSAVAAGIGGVSGAGVLQR